MTDPAHSVPVAADALPDRLPCGVRLDDLLRQVAESSPTADPGHQQTCPHCRAALAELTELWAPVHRMAGEDVRAPASLLGTVMERVGVIATHSWHAVLTGTAGATRIAAWVVTVIARRAAAGVAGVAGVRGHLTPSAGTPGAGTADVSRDGTTSSQRAAAAGVGVAGGRVVVRLDVTAVAGFPLPALAQEIRARVRRDVSAMTGLAVEAVDVLVSDLAEEPPGIVPAP